MLLSALKDPLFQSPPSLLFLWRGFSTICGDTDRICCASGAQMILMAVCMLKCLFFYYCLSLAHLFGIYFHPFTLQFAPHRISVYNVSRHLPSVNRTSLISRHSGPLCFVVYYLFLLHIAALYYAPPNESRLRGIEGNRKVGSKKWKASTQHVQSELSYCCLVFGLYLLALQNG